MCSWSLDLDPTDPHRPTYSIYSTLDAQLRPLSSVKGSASAWYQDISTNWRLDWSSRSCSGLVDYPDKWSTKQSAGSIFLNKTLPQDSWIQSRAWGKQPSTLADITNRHQPFQSREQILPGGPVVDTRSTMPTLGVGAAWLWEHWLLSCTW